MKLVTRIVGSVVIIVVLAGAALYFLNEKGFISGELSSFISSITGHAVGIHDETKDFLENEGYLVTPSPAPTDEPATTAEPSPIPTLIPVDYAD